LHPGWPDASVWGKNIIFLLVLLLDQKYQKSSANDAPPRSEKTAKIQRSTALEGRDVRLSAASFVDFLLFFHSSFDSAQDDSRALPAVRAGLRTQPGLNLAFRVEIAHA
jgi:hypothetical protein